MHRLDVNRPTPSTAPFVAAAALTEEDVGGVQRCIAAGPTAEDVGALDRAAEEMARPHEVTIEGTCPHCGQPVKLRRRVVVPELAGIAARLRVLRDKLARFDGRVLQRLLDRLGEGASLWFTGGS